MMNRLTRIIRPEQIREFSLVVILVLILLFFSSQIENFFGARTFNRIALSVVVVTVVAVGQTLVVLTRNIDLSVGSIVGFTAYFTGQQLGDHPELAPLAAVLIAVGVGALMGLLNGALVAYGRVPSIVVTLGTLAIYRGILVEYSGAQTVTVASLPDWIVGLQPQNLFTIGDLDVKALVVLALAVVIVFQFVITNLQFGRRLYAIGSNPEGARIAGLPTRRTITLAYVLCGALAGLGGFLFLARNGNITVTAAIGLELQVVAAVVVGGVNIFGGSGTMIGALLGAFLIGTLELGLIRMAAISEFWKDALLGLFVLLAISSDALILNRLRNLWARSELKLTDSDEEFGKQEEAVRDA
jgi:rhamnose transport system permease protein